MIFLLVISYVGVKSQCSRTPVLCLCNLAVYHIGAVFLAGWGCYFQIQSLFYIMGQNCTIVTNVYNINNSRTLVACSLAIAGNQRCAECEPIRRQMKVCRDFCRCRTAITHTHTHPFNGHFSWTTQVRRYQKGKTNLDFAEARDSEWQWHQLEHMQVCTSLQIDNHAGTPPLSFLQAGCPSCRPTNSVKALKVVNCHQ